MKKSMRCRRSVGASAASCATWDTVAYHRCQHPYSTICGIRDGVSPYCTPLADILRFCAVFVALRTCYVAAVYSTPFSSPFFH